MIALGPFVQFCGLNTKKLNLRNIVIKNGTWREEKYVFTLYLFFQNCLCHHHIILNVTVSALPRQRPTWYRTYINRNDISLRKKFLWHLISTDGHQFGCQKVMAATIDRGGNWIAFVMTCFIIISCHSIFVCILFILENDIGVMC